MKISGVASLLKIKFPNVWLGLSSTFEQYDYDFSKFLRLFSMGLLASWIITLSVYLVFVEKYTVLNFLGFLLGFALLSIVWFPVSVVQSNKIRFNEIDSPEEDEE